MFPVVLLRHSTEPSHDRLQADYVSWSITEVFSLLQPVSSHQVAQNGNIQMFWKIEIFIIPTCNTGTFSFLLVEIFPAKWGKSCIIWVSVADVKRSQEKGGQTDTRNQTGGIGSLLQSDNQTSQWNLTRTTNVAPPSDELWAKCSLNTVLVVKLPSLDISCSMTVSTNCQQGHAVGHERGRWGKI